MFLVEICSQLLEICKSVCTFIVLTIVVETDELSVVLFRWLPIMTLWRKDKKNHGCWGKHAHIPGNDYFCFMSCEPSFFFFAQLFLCYTRNIFLLASDIFFINWTVRMSDNLPERVQILGHAHICITVRENRIICCQIFSWFFLNLGLSFIF
jgi:hypothetical protein